jgi:acyl transferase domain-containing protein/thioesterase domain-containing protein
MSNIESMVSRESIKPFTIAQLKASGVDKATLENPSFVNSGAFIEDADCFDATFFGFSPLEAEIMDPQHRLFLECAWEAIENAGYNPDTFNGPIGVFGGVSPNTYFQNTLMTRPDLLKKVGPQLTRLSNEKDNATTRVSFKLNLKGPSINVQTNCSSSGVALHLSCQSVLSGECDMALVGGARIEAPLHAGYWYEEGGILSPDGHCKVFDAEARGTVFGNGVAMIVIKRLSDAIRDGDSIQAVIKASAINNDGSSKVGYPAPSVQGQTSVIEEALTMAEVSPDTIGYIEAHGTGTPLGDPIEVAALTTAFRKWTNRKGYCRIGSVKANIGHLFAGAGVAGVIKTVLTANGTPRRAGVSSFGVGGTNAHIILEEAPETEPSGPSRHQKLLLISAKSDGALDNATVNLVEHLKEHPHFNLADVAYTLNIGRKMFDYRRMIVCQDLNDAVANLETLDPEHVLTFFQEPINQNTVFMFSGQGSQYVDMGLELYETESEFREHIDRCSEILKPHLGLDLRDIIYPAKENAEEATHNLKNTLITQPALFTIEYSLAKLWMSWGVQPAALVGHSIGEYVAACLAGVFSLEDALSLVATRGRLMQELPGGSMIAVPLSEKDIEQFLNEELSLSAVNGPSFCTVSGHREAIEDLEKQLFKKNVDCRHLHTSHAFHSKMIDPIIDAFVERAKQVNFDTPRIPIVSTVTGTWVTSDEIMAPVYWAKNLRQTVRFSDCVQELLKEPNRVLLEVGPGQTLSTLVRQHSNESKEQIVLSSIRHPQEHKSDTAFILDTLGRLWLSGIQVNWPGFYKDERRHRVPLPTYSFERQRYWIEPVEQPRGFLASRAGLTNKGVDNSKRSSIKELQNDYVAPRDLDLESDYVHPRNEVEKTITGIWQKVLGVKQIGIYDNYFDLGGNSINAARLFAEIEKVFNKRIPLAILINAPTVEQFASIINKEEWSWSLLVPIQSGGSKPPFFCIHAAGGNVLNYRDLAHYLGPDQPVYGLQSQGLDGEQPFLTRIEDMASLYIKEIQAVQPQGPYFLGGYCLGGTIALEIAQQIYAQGQEVALLALWETYNWANAQAKSLFNKVYSQIQRIEFHIRNFLLLNNNEKLTFIGEKTDAIKDRKKVWAGMIAAKLGKRLQSSNGQNLLLYRLWNVNDHAAVNYVPKVYPGRISHFRPTKDYSRFADPKANWDELAAGGVGTYRLPVYPAGMLVEPFVKLLAQELKVCIDNASKK